MPDGLSLVTNGIIIGKDIDFTTVRIYQPVTLNVASKMPKLNIEETELIPLDIKRATKLLTVDTNEPTITVSPIKKKITLNLTCGEEN